MSSDRSVPTTTLLVCDGNSAIATAYTAVSQPAPPRAFSALSSTQMTANDRSPSIMSHSLKRKNGVHVYGLWKAIFQLGTWPWKLHWRPSSKAFMEDSLWVWPCESLLRVVMEYNYGALKFSVHIFRSTHNKTSTCDLSHIFGKLSRQIEDLGGKHFCISISCELLHTPYLHHMQIYGLVFLL